MRISERMPVVALLVTGALLTVASTAPSAQRRNRGDNASQGAPVTTTGVRTHPDAYYDKPVTLSAAVERVLSTTAFLVDQRKAAGPTEVQAVGTPVLVIAPNLKGPLHPRAYLSVRGRIVKFAPDEIARVAGNYTIDLGAEHGTMYAGQPVLVATSVVDSTFAELAPLPAAPPVR